MIFDYDLKGVKAPKLSQVYFHMSENMLEETASYTRIEVWGVMSQVIEKNGRDF